MPTSSDFCSSPSQYVFIQWLLICAKPVCVCVWVSDHTVSMHGSSPCWGHNVLFRCVAWFTAHTKPHWWLLLRVCGLTPALPQRDVDTHSAASLQWGAKVGELISATDSAHFFFLPSPSSVFYFFSHFLPSSSVVTVENSSGMCGWLSKLACLSERHESTGRLPKTTTFRSHS